MTSPGQSFATSRVPSVRTIFSASSSPSVRPVASDNRCDEVRGRERKEVIVVVVPKYEAGRRKDMHHNARVGSSGWTIKKYSPRGGERVFRSITVGLLAQ
jgi:hypothetical protein